MLSQRDEIFAYLPVHGAGFIEVGVLDTLQAESVPTGQTLGAVLLLVIQLEAHSALHSYALLKTAHTYLSFIKRSR